MVDIVKQWIVNKLWYIKMVIIVLIAIRYMFCVYSKSNSKERY